MQRLIVVQMVSIIPLVQFPSSWDICLIGCKQPSALFDLGARLTSQAWIITQTAFYLLSFRIWIGSGFRSVWLCHRPSRQLHALILQHIQCHSLLVYCTAPGLSHHLIVKFDYMFFLLFYCGLKSPGVDSALSPASALGEFLTEPFLCLLF